MLFIIILIVSLVLQLFLPWWIIAIIAFSFSSWKALNAKHAFVHSFTAILLLWVAAGLIKTIPNENILANRVGELLMLPFAEFNWIIILFVTGIIGGLVAGLSGLAGFYLRELFIKQKT